MIEETKYIKIVKLFYSFLEIDFSFKEVNETVNGNTFYDVEYKSEKRVISISYENIDNYLEVTVFQLQNGQIPDYDNKSKTHHLNQLNKLVMPKSKQNRN